METPKAFSLQSLATMVFTGVMVWCGSRIAENWHDNTVTSTEAKANAELRAQLIACRNRELDDVKARILHMEHPTQ